MESNGAGSPLRVVGFALSVLVAVALAHGASLWLPFLCDDWFLVHEASMPRTWLQELGFGWASFTQWIRPVTLVSIRVQTALHGPEPLWFHAFGLLVHAAAACALGWVIREWGGSRFVAAAAALLFAVHPLTVEAVAWVAARSDLLCGLFTALALASTLRYQRGGGRGAAVAAIACGLLAALSKESALALVLFVPLTPRGAAPEQRSRWLRSVVVTAVLAGGYAAVRLRTFGGIGGYEIGGESQHLVGGIPAVARRLLGIARALASPARRESFPAGLGVLRWLPAVLLAAGAARACRRSPRGFGKACALWLGLGAAVALPLATWWEFEFELRGQRSLYQPIALTCAALAFALEALSEQRALRSGACAALLAALAWPSTLVHRGWRVGGDLSERVFEKLSARVVARDDHPVVFTVDQPDSLGPAFLWRNGLTQATWLRLGSRFEVYPLTGEETKFLSKPREARERMLRVTYTIRLERPILCLRWDREAGDWVEL